jgi:hypothetical protein
MSSYCDMLDSTVWFIIVFQVEGIFSSMSLQVLGSLASFTESESQEQGLEVANARYLDKHEQKQNLQVQINELKDALISENTARKAEIDTLKVENLSRKAEIAAIEGKVLALENDKTTMMEYLAKPCLASWLEITFREDMSSFYDDLTEDELQKFSLVVELKQGVDNWPRPLRNFTRDDVYVKTAVLLDSWLEMTYYIYKGSPTRNAIIHHLKPSKDVVSMAFKSLVPSMQKKVRIVFRGLIDEYEVRK